MEKLSQDQIFKKTMKFMIFRMMIPLISAVISVVAVKVTTGIVENNGGSRMGIVTILIWFLVSLGVYIGLSFFVGYKFHASQMAIIADAVSFNMFPDDIKAYVLKTYELKVSSLYISQVKRKLGLEVGEAYCKPKSDKYKTPQCPEEKEQAIVAALEYFKMI